MTERTGHYKRLTGLLLKVSLFFLLIGVSLILFVVTKRVREPRVAYNLLEYPNDLQIESALFESLDNSFVARERLENGSEARTPFGGEEFVSIEYSPRYQPLLDPKGNSLLEAYLYREQELVPCREAAFVGRSDISWTFALTKRVKVFQMNVADMIPADSPVWKQGDSALFVANYTLHQAVNLPGGLKEISVSAANYSKGEMTKEYDPASHLVITVDNQVIGDTYLKRPDFMKFAFQFYGSEGWRMLGISFDNDEYVPERGQDRNVLVKDVEISQLVGSVFVNIRKKLRDRYRPESYTLSYFRSLPEEERNDLTRFYKSRFLVESLKDVIAKNYSVWALIKHVEIGGLTKEAIFAPSPTKLRWRLKVPMGGMRLSFGYGIMEEAWRRPGDGVEFRVRLDTKPEEPEIVLFSRYINPKSSEKDRQWFTAVVDVTRYSGKEITLLFETAGSPARQITPVLDTAYDYAVWSS